MKRRAAHNGPSRGLAVSPGIPKSGQIMVHSRNAKKRRPSPEHADTLSLNALRSLVTGLLERSKHAEAWLEKLEAETTPATISLVRHGEGDRHEA